MAQSNVQTIDLRVCPCSAHSLQVGSLTQDGCFTLGSTQSQLSMIEVLELMRLLTFYELNTDWVHADAYSIWNDEQSYVLSIQRVFNAESHTIKPLVDQIWDWD